MLKMLGFSQISVNCYVVLCITSVKVISYPFGNLSKMAEQCKKIELRVQKEAEVN
jgi:hypothetical protein